MIERVEWSVESLIYLGNIRSSYFTEAETSTYRRRLMHEIERKIILVGSSIPSKEEQYFGTYRVMVDRHKIYYSLDSNGTLAYIEAIKHVHMHEKLHEDPLGYE